MSEEYDDRLNRFRQAISAWRKRRENGQWIEAADDREQAYDLLNQLLEMLIEGDQELLVLDREEATVLELLARETLDRAGNSIGGGRGYGKLRRLIMNHPDWTFLPSRSELKALEEEGQDISDQARIELS